MINAIQLSRVVKLGEPQPVHLLLTKELSSMVSTWEEHLGFQQISENRWRVGTFVYNWLSIDAIPEADRYNEDGELVIPDEIDGRKIHGLVDGEYLETDELITRDEVEFGVKDLKLARQFCLGQGWDEVADFEYAWFLIESTLRPKKAPSRFKAFKQMAIVRAGSAASMSGYSESELAIYRTQKTTDIWVWSAESETERLFQMNRYLSFGEILQVIADDEQFCMEVDWSNISGRSISKAAAIILACACSFDEGGKTIARLVGKIPDTVLLPALDRLVFDGIKMCQMGDQLLHSLTDRNLSTDAIQTISPKKLDTEDDLFQCLKGAVNRARRQAAKDLEQTAKLAPFLSQIDRIVNAYRVDKPKRYYPGAGYVVPALGVHSLRVFLIDYAQRHLSLPRGVIDVPYDEKEIGRPSVKSFSVDLTKLA